MTAVQAWVHAGLVAVVVAVGVLLAADPFSFQNIREVRGRARTPGRRVGPLPLDVNLALDLGLDDDGGGRRRMCRHPSHPRRTRAGASVLLVPTIHRARLRRRRRDHRRGHGTRARPPGSHVRPRRRVTPGGAAAVVVVGTVRPGLVLDVPPRGGGGNGPRGRRHRRRLWRAPQRPPPQRIRERRFLDVAVARPPGPAVVVGVGTLGTFGTPRPLGPLERAPAFGASLVPLKPRIGPEGRLQLRRLREPPPPFPPLPRRRRRYRGLVRTRWDAVRRAGSPGPAQRRRRRRSSGRRVRRRH